MTKEIFKYILDQLKEQEIKNQKLYELDIDITNFLDSHHKVITTLLKVYYGEEGEDWLSWYLYERDPEGSLDQATDADGNPLCYDFDSLWETMEKCRLEKEEYVLPKKMTIEDMVAYLKELKSKN